MAAILTHIFLKCYLILSAILEQSTPRHVTNLLECLNMKIHALYKYQ